MTRKDKKMQLKKEIKNRKTYLKQNFLISLFSGKRFLIETFFILSLSLVFFIKGFNDVDATIHLTSFILTLVLCGGISDVFRTKELFIDEIEKLDKILRAKNIPDVIELKYDRKIKL